MYFDVGGSARTYSILIAGLILFAPTVSELQLIQEKESSGKSVKL